MPRSALARETLICGHVRSAPLTVSERRLTNGTLSCYVFGKFIGSCQTTLGHKLSQGSMMFLRRSGVVSRLIRGPRIVYPLRYSLYGGSPVEFSLGFVSLNITPHFYKYVSATCKVWRHFDAPKRVFPQNPNLWSRAFCLFDCLRTTVDRWSFFLVCVW